MADAARQIAHVIFIILNRQKLRHAAHMTNPSQNLPTRQIGTLILGIAVLVALGVDIIPTFFIPRAQLASGDWFVGGDTYMRIVRVREWLDAGAWHANFSPRSNAPFGETLHWTRPMDMVLVALAAPFIPFVGLNEALYFSGFMVSPFMFGVTLWALLWGTRRFLDIRGQIILVMLFTFQPVTHDYFVAARPDHHSMILLGFAAALSLLARHAIEPEAEKRTITWAGVIVALGTWVSVESLTIELLALLALGMSWIVTGRAVWLDALRRFTLAGAATLALALMVERPPAEWLASETYDSLSTVQVLLFTLIALGIEAIRRGHAQFKDSFRVRLTAATLAAAVAAAVMLAVFPDFFKGPFGAAMDPRLEALWLSQVNEFRPLFGTERSTVVEITFLFGPMIWATIWAYTAWRDATRAPYIPTLIWVLGLSIAMFAPLTLMQIRWAAYMGVVVVIPWALLLIHVLDWRGGPAVGPAPGTPMLRAPLFLLIAIGHIVLGGTYLAMFEEKETDIPQECHWRDIAPYLNSPEFANGEPQTFLNFIHTGPEILYRTRHRVIGTPYHRNAQGILDTLTVLTGTDFDESRAILQNRKVDFVVLCVNSVEEKLMLEIPGDTLMRRLIEGISPAWLAPAPLPDGLKAYFRFYRFSPDTP